SPRRESLQSRLREFGITQSSLGSCGRIVIAKNRFPLFRTMLQGPDSIGTWPWSPPLVSKPGARVFPRKYAWISHPWSAGERHDKAPGGCAAGAIPIIHFVGFILCNPTSQAENFVGSAFMGPGLRRADSNARAIRPYSSSA